MWETVKISDVCTIKGRIGYRGYTKGDLVEAGEGAISLSPLNIISNKINFTKSTYISWEKYYESPEIMLEIDDIVFCKTASIGKLAIVEDLPVETTLNPQFVVLKNICCDNRFLYYAIQSPSFSSQISGIIGGTAIPTLSQKNLGELVISLPPIAEQQRIVAKLDAAFAEIDDAIETTKNSKDNALKLYEALSREVFFAGDDVVPLRDIATVIMGQSPNGKSYNADGVGTPLVNGPVEFEEGSFGRSKSIKFTTQPTKFCKSGDALLCVRGSTTGRMNLASVDACIGRGVAAIRAHNNQQWINYFLQSARGYIFSIGTGATFPNVSSKQIESIEIRNPNEEEKRELIYKLSECYENIQVINKTYDLKKSNLVTLKSAILAQELRSEAA